MPYRKKNYATAYYHYEEILRQTNIYLKKSIHDFNVKVIFPFVLICQLMKVDVSGLSKY